MAERPLSISRERGISAALKEQIFRAAMEVFSEKGFERATVEEVAERAGLARGTIYYHFRSKRDLFLFLMEEGIDLMAVEVEAAVEAAPDTRAALDALVDAHVEFFHRYRDFARVLMLETWRLEPEVEVSPQRVLANDLRVVGRVFAQAKRERMLRDIDEPTLLSGFFGLVCGVAVYYTTYQSDFPREKVKRALRDLFLAGALAGPAAKRRS